MKTTEMKLEAVLAEMLTTSTGIAMMDSGGSNGRSWQQNQAKVGERSAVEVFEAEPVSTWSWPTVYNRALWQQGLGNVEPNDKPAAERIALHADGRAELNPVHSVYHWLCEALSDYAEEMDAALREFDESLPNWGYLQIMEEFPRHYAVLQARKAAAEELGDDEYIADGDSEDLAETLFIQPKGLYGESDGPMIVNTYNGEDALSQTLQYAYFEYDGESYVLLQIHQGADVRGGYTRPVAFMVDDMDMSIFDNARGGCGCTECDARWYSDDAGGNWYSDEGRPNLHELPARMGTFVEQAFLNAKSGLLMPDELPTIIIEEVGEYANTNIVRCPMCPTGTLDPYIF